MIHFDYIHDPREIERQSFVQIRELADLSRFDPDQQQVAMRLIHTCGDPAIIDDLYFSEGAVEAGLEALRRRTAILCDVEMVRQGLSRRYLDSPVHCFLNTQGIEAQAKGAGETRSMTALAWWKPHLAGGIVAIGNAPTALFRLLEMLAEGAPRPALIIGMPVGFVGARESKQALLEYAPSRLDVPCITLRGRRGGSALTAATVNALIRLSRGIRL